MTTNERIAEISEAAKHWSYVDCGAGDNIAWLITELRAARQDSERLDWLDAQHRGIEAGTMDDQNGEPTRKLFVVDGAGADAMMYTVREAIDHAQERYPTVSHDHDDADGPTSVYVLLPDDEANDAATCRLLAEMIAEHEENITQLNARLKGRSSDPCVSQYWMSLESNVRSSADAIASLQHAIRRISGQSVGSVLPQQETR